MSRQPEGPRERGLRLGAGAELVHEPRLLHSAAFLGTLHAQLEAEVGISEAAQTLLQLGFVQGLRDATRLLHEGFFDASPDLGGVPTAPLLTMRLRPPPERGSRAGPRSCAPAELRGSWPEETEARARVRALGASTRPSCHVSAGYTSGWLSGLLEIDLLAIESSCSARGDAECEFVVREPECWRAQGDARADPILECLDFGYLRDRVASELAIEPPREAAGAFDSGSPVVHVWGPVMVAPFSGPEASLRAVELIQRDAGAAAVSVVVVDLGGVIVDDGLGALALERVLDAIDAAGAEAILTGVAPMCESTIATLERRPLLVEKDLAQAIATAFQVAEARRRPA